MSLSATDEAGAAVLALDSLVAREVFREQLERLRSGGGGSLLRVEWEPLAAAGQGSSVAPEAVVVDACEPPAGTPGAPGGEDAGEGDAGREDALQWRRR